MKNLAFNPISARHCHGLHAAGGACLVGSACSRPRRRCRLRRRLDAPFGSLGAGDAEGRGNGRRLHDDYQ